MHLFPAGWGSHATRCRPDRPTTRAFGDVCPGMSKKTSFDLDSQRRFRANRIPRIKVFRRAEREFLADNSNSPIPVGLAAHFAPMPSASAELWSISVWGALPPLTGLSQSQSVPTAICARRAVTVNRTPSASILRFLRALR